MSQEKGSGWPVKLMIGGAVVVVPLAVYEMWVRGNWGAAKSKNPFVPEEQGGPTRTNQVTRGSDFDGEGSRTGSRGGADEQANKRRLFDDDDDDPTGATGDGQGAWNGAVDADFDARVATVGILVTLAITALFLVFLASRSGGRTSVA